MEIMNCLSERVEATLDERWRLFMTVISVYLRNLSPSSVRAKSNLGF
ncbi:hypothetical protein O97_00911 [Bartonella henselae str. Zeus]|nr:hypothetical protein Q653_00121 [Bartonella henselae JK 42]ETS15210.1 hypothetical protein Q652_00253 [Bartonella henselae JK 41]KEC57093.1 hypothetical protein O97_00911 [Bartonella henselae str. Zeus]KEC59681.1 hypothetical protein O95_01000 [Bartonella henselae JK 53]